jgi:hypothetical protein
MLDAAVLEDLAIRYDPSARGEADPSTGAGNA